MKKTIALGLVALLIVGLAIRFTLPRQEPLDPLDVLSKSLEESNKAWDKTLADLRESNARLNESLAMLRESNKKAELSYWRKACNEGMTQPQGLGSGYLPPFRETCMQEFGLDLPHGSLDESLYRQYWDPQKMLPLEKKAWENYLASHPEAPH